MTPDKHPTLFALPTEPRPGAYGKAKGDYSATRCECCGVPWIDHTADCPRHAYRPGVAPEPAAAPSPARFEVVLSADLPGYVLLRVSPNPGAPYLTLTADETRLLVAALNEAIGAAGPAKGARP